MPIESVKVAYPSPKTGLGRGASQKKLAPEAYCAIGAVARNSLANRALVGNQVYWEVPDILLPDIGDQPTDDQD